MTLLKGPLFEHHRYTTALTVLPFCTQKPCSLWEEFLKAQKMQDQVEVRHGHTGCVFGT